MTARRAGPDLSGCMRWTRTATPIPPAMEISRDQARQICSVHELQLVDASFPPELQRLGITELRDHVERAKRLQDRYRDLSRRQDRASKATAATPGSQNIRTREKALLFQETRERFEDHLAELAGEA